MVAKGIFHIDDDPNMSASPMNRAFEVEAEVLSRLPPWWGIRLVDAFHAGHVRIIVTPELPTSSWRLYEPSVARDRAAAASLEKQLRWLNHQHIAHRDLELKNVLLTPAGPVIIDFEKAELEAGKDMMLEDWRKIADSLRERDNTRRIADFLMERAPTRRRKSVGGRGRGRAKTMRQRRM
jgi:serine/threonine protein kinase